jgi:gas vesicle protein
MYAARPIARSAVPRAARALRAPARQARFQSTTSSAANAAKPASSHIAAGVAGGVAGAVALYGIFLMTPTGQAARKINKAAKETQKTYQQAAKKLQETTPNADQAINYIKDFCYSYVAWVPGGRAYVDAAFKDIDTLRENHGDEVEKIVTDAYKKLQDISKNSGMSLDTAAKVYDVVADTSKQLGALAGDAIGDILDNHPQIKDKVGPGVDQLKQMGENYGPEAKKAVDETWKQVKDIAAGGLTLETVNKIRKLIQEKQDQIQKLGDEAWKKGMEQAKPYLDKNPKIKELLEKNGDALKNGNYGELFNQVKEAASSGNLDQLQDYVSKAAEKAKSKGHETFGGSFDQLFKMIPEGSEIMPKVQQLAQVFKEHSKEGEQLLKETADDLKKLLEDKAKKAQSIADKAKKDAK